MARSQWCVQRNHVFPGKLISPPHNCPYFSSPNGENTNTEEYLPWAQDCATDSTKIVLFNPPYALTRLQLYSSTLQMTELRIQGVTELG